MRRLDSFDANRLDVLEASFIDAPIYSRNSLQRFEGQNQLYDMLAYKTQAPLFQSHALTEIRENLTIQPQMGGPQTVDDIDGMNGFTAFGRSDFSLTGYSISHLGDINDDGIDDIGITSLFPNPSGPEVGEAYVIFGNASGSFADLDVGSLTGSNGFRVTGESGNKLLGWDIDGLGDVNGDGVDDFIIGYKGGEGGAYVVFGSASGLPANLDITSLNGTNGFEFGSTTNTGDLGRNVSNLGDINGDGINDMAVSAFYEDGSGGTDSGAVYIVYGSSTAYAAYTDITTLNGTDGFRIDGLNPGDGTGIRNVDDISNAGDINGDGIDDFMFSAVGLDGGGTADTGGVYVVFGTTSGFGSSFDLSTLDGTNGFLVHGIGTDDLFGSSMASAGDINGDGHYDIVIGAGFADPNGRVDAGAAYIIYGQNTPFNAVWSVSDLDGTNGFSLYGSLASDSAGISVDGVGDFNGDGVDDIVVGAGFAERGGLSNVGEAYVIYGNTSGFGSVIELSGLTAQTGYTIRGSQSPDLVGFNVSAAGDFNNDGFMDIMTSGQDASYDADPNVYDGRGETHIIFGFETPACNEVFGTTGNDIFLSGTAGCDIIYAYDGNDTIFGDGGEDTVYAGGGDDFIQGYDGADYIDGGTGVDRVGYDLSDAAVFIDLATASLSGGYADGDTLISIEGLNGSAFNDDLRGNASANTLIGRAGNDLIIGRNGDDMLYGEIGQDTLLGGNGADFLSGGTDNDLLRGGDGNDDMYGDNGVDKLHGESGNDSLFGGDGNDSLWGGQGSDLLDGGAGTDSVYYNTSTSSIFLNLATGSHGGDAAGDTFVSIERFYGSNQNDFMFGNVDSNWFNGLDGNDFLFGGGGNDEIRGGDGNDTLFGDAGMNDKLFGGTGADVFVFNTDSDRELVMDFSEVEGDRIDVSAFGFTDFADLEANANVFQSSNGIWAIIDLDAGGRMMLRNFDHTNMDDADFIF